MVNYWIFKVKDEMGGLYGRRGWAIFDHRSKEGFWSIKERSEGKPEPNTEQLQKGDKAIFYLIGKGKDESKFIADATIDSTFTQLDEAQTKQLVHPDFIDTDQGVFIKDVHKWGKSLPIGVLKGKDGLVHQTVNVGSHFQGRLKKIEKADYEAIMHEHECTF
jgi:hypothetical protein